jgi:pSer/pThr/pTyr-binding forkhead associated (FHA) protein
VALILKVLDGKHAGKEIRVPSSAKFMIGRGEECHLRPNSDAVSRRHCLFEYCDSEWTIRDLGSGNGTFVNSVRAVGACTLSAGDKVTVGPLAFEIQITVPRPAAVAAKVAAEAPEKSVLDDDVAAWLKEDGPPSGGDTVILSREETSTLQSDLSGAKPKQAPAAPSAPSSREAALEALQAIKKNRLDRLR